MLEILFLAAVCSAFGLFIFTLAWAVWYCRDKRGLAPRSLAKGDHA
jgi:hypothetical protein